MSVRTQNARASKALYHSYPRCGWSDLAFPCGALALAALALAALALAAHRAVAAGGALASVGGASAGSA